MKLAVGIFLHQLNSIMFQSRPVVPGSQSFPDNSLGTLMAAAGSLVNFLKDVVAFEWCNALQKWVSIGFFVQVPFVPNKPTDFFFKALASFSLEGSMPSLRKLMISSIHISVRFEVWT